MSTLTYGQNQRQSSQYMFNKYASNPAYAGLDFSLSSTLQYRNQWDGIPGKPKDFTLNGHMPVYLWNGAVGAMIERHSSGVNTLTGLAFSYNFVTDFRFGLVSFGGRLGVNHISVDGNRIVTPEGDYNPGFNHNDPILPINQDNGLGIKWDIGAYFYNKKMEAGFAISNLPSTSLGLDNFDFDQLTVANLYLQYTFPLIDNITLMQSILLKSDFIKIQSDVSSIIKINGNIFGGLSLRGYSSQSLDALVFIIGMKLNDNYTLSYSYDLGLSSLNVGHEGSHEILLNYNLRKMIGTGEAPKVIYNPRHL